MPQVKIICLFVASLWAMAGAMAQSEWTLPIPASDKNVWITDAAPFDGGYLVSMHTWETSNEESRSYLLRVDNEGSILDTLPLQGDQCSAVASVILTDASGDVAHVLGTARSCDGIHSLFHHRILSGSLLADSMLIPIPGVVRLGLSNAILTPEGEIIAIPYARYGSDLYGRSYIIKLHEQGALLDWTMLQESFLLMARDIIPYNGNFLIAFRGGAEDAMNTATYAIVDHDLDIVDQFTGTAYDGSGEIPFGEGVIIDHMYMLPMEGGDVLVCGITGAYSGIKTVVQKMAGSGEVVAYFEAPSSYEHSFTGYYESITRTMDGRILFIQQNNLTVSPVWQPTAPSDLIIHELDTDLQHLCTDTIHGVVHGQYNMADRIKATPDGGFMVLSKRMDLSQQAPMLFDGRIEKFSDLHCTTGILPEHKQVGIRVHPNPGQDRCILSFSEYVGRPHTAELYDTHGRLVAQATTKGEEIIFNTSGLLDGVYHYRLVDVHRSLVHAGSWIKQ